MGIEEIVRAGAVSVNDVSFEQYAVLKECGWMIVGDVLTDPTRSRVEPAGGKPGKTKAKRPSPPQGDRAKDTSTSAGKSRKKPQKQQSRKRPKPRKAAKAKKRKPKASSPLLVPLSAEAMKRLHSHDAFQSTIHGLEPRTPGPGFVHQTGSDKINWTDGSEDGSMWNHKGR